MAGVCRRIAPPPDGNDHKASIHLSQPLLESGSKFDGNNIIRKKQPRNSSPGGSSHRHLETGNPQDLVTQTLSHKAKSLNVAPPGVLASKTALQIRGFGVSEALTKLAGNANATADGGRQFA